MARNKTAKLAKKIGSHIKFSLIHDISTAIRSGFICQISQENRQSYKVFFDTRYFHSHKEWVYMLNEVFPVRNFCYIFCKIVQFF